MSQKSSSSVTSSADMSSLAESVPRGPKLNARPLMIFYRFLDVIKEKHNLVVEMVNYVSQNLCAFLERHSASADLTRLIDIMRDESRKEGETDAIVPVIFEGPQQSIHDSLFLYTMYKCMREHQRLDIGHNNDSIRTLVHWVVLEGVINGTFRIAIHPAFVDTFRHWQERRVLQVVFSSVTHDLGSCRLLSNTDQGDLTRYFQFLDLPMNTRSKETYSELAKNLNIPPANLLLVTFSETESKKAARAGFKVAKIVQRLQPKVAYASVTLVNDLSELRMA